MSLCDKALSALNTWLSGFYHHHLLIKHFSPSALIENWGMPCNNGLGHRQRHNLQLSAERVFTE